MTPSRRPFLAFALAEVLSLSGTRLSMIAIPWLVLTTTGDAMLTGLVAFAEMLPYVIAKALGGPLIDRIGARRIAVIADLGALTAVGLIPLLHALGALTVPTLLPVVAILGLIRGPADAAKHALIPAVALHGDLPMERVTGVAGTIERLASTMGAAAAGALVAVLGPANALILNAATFGGSALVIALGTSALEHARSDANEDGTQGGSQGYLADLRAGWDFLRRDAVLVGIVVMVAVTNLLDQGFATVLVPVWAERTGEGAAILGLLLATMSGASVAGAALATGLADRLPRLPVYAIAFLITGFPRFMVFAVEAPVTTIFAVVATAGFASGFLNPILSAVIFERIPTPLVGRVSSLVTASTWSTMPFGGLAAGAAIAAITLPGAFAAAGIAYLGATMLPLTLKSFRALERRPPGAPSPETTYSSGSP